MASILDAMAEATRNRGYAYFGVSDHSKSAHYAGGLSVEEIAEQLWPLTAERRVWRKLSRL
jgi:histidinol phosphatase-like PHP family hydrolase